MACKGIFRVLLTPGNAPCPIEMPIKSIEQVRQYYADKIGAQALDELEARLRAAASRLELDYLPPFWAGES